MRTFNLTVVILNITDKAKPLLIKLLPIQFLRRAKRLIISRKMKRLAKGGSLKPFAREAYLDGVNLVGYIQGETGLGQSCRLLAHALEKSGIPFSISDYIQVSAIRFSDDSWLHKITDQAIYNINIIHINPYEIPLAFSRLGRHLWDRRYNIAYWLWELEVFPEEWENAFLLADEIWAPSEFVCKSIRKSTDKPVFVIPYVFPPLDCGDHTRKDFQLPEDKVLFLSMYDSSSITERKNPLGAIRAYKQAFSIEDNHVGLVVKINNLENQDIRQLKSELEGYPNTYFITDVLDRSQVNALIACVDVFVSLHRAEGFGLVLAEAMLLGTAVIATNWSANAEFMNCEVSCPVNFELILLNEDYGPFRAGNRWADPDLTQAAEYMKRLSENDTYRAELSKNARIHMEKHFAPERTFELMKNRINQIYDKEVEDEDHDSDYGGGKRRALLAEKQKSLAKTVSVID